jgi:aquaporin TIP
MSGGVEMIASAVVQRVAGMLGDIAWERLQLLWNYKEDVQDMEGKMATLQAVLSYADKRSREADDALVQHWLKKYKSVAYDIEDTLDELVADALIWEARKCTVRILTLGPPHMHHGCTIFV